MLNLLLLNAVFMADQPVGPDIQTHWQELFEWSKSEKRGILVYTCGESIVGIVVQVGKDFIELRNQQYGSIFVKLDQIIAVAGK